MLLLILFLFPRYLRSPQRSNSSALKNCLYTWLIIDKNIFLLYSIIIFIIILCNLYYVIITTIVNYCYASNFYFDISLFYILSFTLLYFHLFLYYLIYILVSFYSILLLFFTFILYLLSCCNAKNYYVFV